MADTETPDKPDAATTDPPVTPEDKDKPTDPPTVPDPEKKPESEEKPDPEKKPESGEEPDPEKKPDTEKEPDADEEPDPGKKPDPGKETDDQGKEEFKSDCMPSTPSGEELPKGDFDKIIKETLVLLQMCQKKVDDQKLDSLSLSFLLTKIKESLDVYSNDYFPRLNTFLTDADAITAQYYAGMCCLLPRYGDYVKELEDEEGKYIDDGAGTSLPKNKVLKIVKDVVDNYYHQALILRSVRGLMQLVNKSKDLRNDVVCEVFTHLPTWVKIQNSVTCLLDNIREEAFGTTSSVDFLKQGETRMGPVLDFSKLQTV